MQQRKIPMRKCIGCNEMYPKRELIRIVRSPENEISLDTTGKKPGRGAYICKKAECLKQAVKTKRLNRTFSCEISAEIYTALEKEIQQYEQ